MIDIKPNWLEENATRRWEYLKNSDLKKRQQYQKTRKWKRKLLVPEIELIDKAKTIEELNVGVATIEESMRNLGFEIPPNDRENPDNIIIPFVANPQIKEVKTKEEAANYKPNANEGEIFVRYTYKEKKENPNYIIDKDRGERLAGINADNTLRIEVPDKAIIDKVTFEPPLVVQDYSSYCVYLLRQQQNKSEWNIKPTRLGGSIIETYEQFKINLLKTISSDYLEIETSKHDPNFSKVNLSNLCSFVEKYLKSEPLGAPKRHLIELLKNIKIELVSHKSFFWDRIQKHVEIPEANVPPAPYLTPEISHWLQRVRDFISFRYAPYLVKDELGRYPMCPDIILFTSDVEAIIADLEMLLRDVYYKWINNPRLFTGKLWTQITDNVTGSKRHELRGYDKKERNFSKTIETDLLPDQPVKTARIDILNAWDNHKGLIFRTQRRDKVDEATKYDNLNLERKGGENTQRGGSRNIAKDIELDARKLEWLEKVVDKFLIYKNISAILDKHFYSEMMVLPTSEELGI